MRARVGVPSLRSGRAFAAVRRAITRGNKEWFRIVHFSAQTDHVHLMVEADDRTSLSRGMQGLAVRCAKAINRALDRRGAVWRDRYHGRALTTPREVRNCLCYVLLNFCKHLRARPGIDPASSGAWFDGWAHPPLRGPPPGPSPVCAPTTWLLSVGWRRAGGPIAWSEAPRPPAPSQTRAVA